MTTRTPPKRSTPPSNRPIRATRRGIPVQDEADPAPLEPFFSSRPTRREVTAIPELPPRSRKETGPRGQFSIAAARGIPADVVSGTIDGPGRKRGRTTKSPVADEVQFVSATKRHVTVLIQGKPVTLERHAAVALASMIFTAFE